MFDLHGHPVETPKQKFYCENTTCPYGSEWDQGKEVTRNHDGTVPEYLRNHDTVCQEPKYKGPDAQLWNKFCLNCYHDSVRGSEELYDYV